MLGEELKQEERGLDKAFREALEETRSTAPTIASYIERQVARSEDPTGIKTWFVNYVEGRKNPRRWEQGFPCQAQNAGEVPEEPAEYLKETPHPRLFLVQLQGPREEFAVFLYVAHSQKEAKERAEEESEEWRRGWAERWTVIEISEVDGYKIELKQKTNP